MSRRIHWGPLFVSDEGCFELAFMCSPFLSHVHVFTFFVSRLLFAPYEYNLKHSLSEENHGRCV